MKRLLVFVVLLISSCANLPTITSISENGNKVDGYRFYDADSKIRYQVSHTDKALHIRLNTTDRLSITKILDFGLHFYFDPVAKKSKKTYIHYPIGKANNELAGGMGLDRGAMDLKSKVLKVSQEYLFKQDGKEEQLLQAMLNTGIQVSLTATSADELTYDLKIPFDKISNATLSNLSIGIVSGSVERSEDDSRPPQQQQNNNMRPGNQMGGNVGQMRTRIAPMEQPVEIWFQLEM